MPKLFVDKTIDIDAPRFKVWDVLTKPQYTGQWAPEFAGGTPFRIESDWRVGSPVLWKDERDQTIVEGNVTRVEPEKSLRFTVFDVRNPEKPQTSEEDGITFELIESGSHTRLQIKQGDFAVMRDGGKFHRLSDEVWDRVLPKIKELAEKPAAAE